MPNHGSYPAERRERAAATVTDRHPSGTTSGDINSPPAAGGAEGLLSWIAAFFVMRPSCETPPVATGRNYP